MSSPSGVPILLAAAILVFGAVSGAQAPSIHFESLSWDFGEIDQGERTAYLFEYRNAGDAPLELSDVTAACGCTIPSFSRDPLAPGESAHIKVIFDSTNREGPQKRALSVRSNDPLHRRITLIIEGTVIAPPAPEIQCSARRIDFGLLDEGATLEQDVTVRNAGETDLVISAIAGSVAELRGSLTSDGPIPPGAEATIRVSIEGAGTVPERAFELRLLITSNDPIESEVGIVCQGYRRTSPRGRLVIPEAPIDVGVVDQEDVKLIDVPVLNDGEAALSIVAVKGPGFGVEVAGAEGLVIPAGGLASLEIRSARQLRKGTYVHRVLLVFEDAGNGQRFPQELLLSGYFTHDSPKER